MRISLVALAALVVAMPAHAQLTLRVARLPASTPPEATVYVAGNFNGWAPDSARYALVRAADGAYSVTLPDAVRGPVEFKLTLGSWARSETTASGAPAPNRRATVPATGAQVVELVVDGWSSPSTVAAPARHTATSSVSILSEGFPLSELLGARRVWLYLPPGYATSGRRYPVLYLQDGQNVFDAATSFAGEWGVDETLDSLSRAGGPEAIVVAVDNGGARRLQEYNPWAEAPVAGGGQGERYAEFIVRTLKPYIDHRYRTMPDTRHTFIGGSSAGALIALYETLRYPKVFGGALLFSSATWLAGTHMYELARNSRPGRVPPRLYFASGAYETPEGQPALDQRRMVDTLRRAGFPMGTSLRSLTVPDGKHSEWFWRREFPAAFVWLMQGRSAAAPVSHAAPRAARTGAAQ